MKKKTFLVILLMAFCFILYGCGEKEEVVMPKEKLTLDKMAELINNSNAYAGIKCTDLKDFDVTGSIGDKILLSNGYLYSLLLEKDKQYSNDEQCMKASNTLFKKVIGSNYLLGHDDKMYSSYDLKKTDYVQSIYGNGVRNWYEINLTEAEKKKYPETQKYENNVYTTYSYRKFYLLKSDGNIYEAFYKMKYSYKNNKRTLSLAKEKVIYSVDEYGHISDFLISSSSMPKMEMIVSNTGIYVPKIIETEECMKYEDVACETKLTKVEDFDKYKDQYKYLDKNIVVTKKNAILKTSVAFNINNARSIYLHLFEDYDY